LIAVDTNVIVYAHRAELPQHVPALAALRELAEGDQQWGIPVHVVGEFVRVVTHPRIFSPPSPTRDALAVIDVLLQSPSAQLLVPGPRHWTLLQSAIEDAAATGNLVLDAQIVATCRENGCSRILTNDRDFRRFSSVSVEPLI
jgi:toxin-antitoxin system PIN domain toxin